MGKRKRRHLSSAGFILALILLIAGIYGADAIYRLFFQTKTENIVGTGGFSLTGSDDSNTSPDTPSETDGTEETVSPDVTVLQLTAADQANGALVLVDQAHPYTGNQNWSDFSAISDENVKPRDTSLSIQAEIQQSLCNLFDAYAASNGYANLQVYSTLDSTLDASSIYTNVLPDRSCGYSFDIGLITSTGEVVPYIKKRNEWMVTNSWEYGFILRYPENKTEVTGISYAPHHFRYVGDVHAAIMHENNFCLEEYLNYLQNYTMESGGLSYTDASQSYIIYYVPADLSGTTTVQLPKDVSYSVSGDNRGGYIITTTSGDENMQNDFADTTNLE